VSEDVAADDQHFLTLIERQKKWQAANSFINDIYTMRRNASGQVHLVVDSETDYDRDGIFAGEKEERTKPGEVYSGVTGAMLRTFSGEAVFDGTPFQDRWGIWVSAYSPLHDKEGNVEAILGLDFSAKDWIGSILLARVAVLGPGLAIVVAAVMFTAVSAIQQAELRDRNKAALELQSSAEVLKAANAELAAARDTAQSASRAKSEFLANMSHEIRTPMNGIIGLTELVLKSPLNAEQRRHMELVQSSADALMTVLNDILDFSKIEANKLTLDPHPFDLRDMLGDTMKLFGLRAHHRGVELAYRIPPEVPHTLIADAGRIRQVLVNLVGNAVKFTHQGEIVVSVEQKQDPDQKVTLTFCVRDTGIGISAEKLRQIFDPFVQADNSTTRKYGGTGLGLTIVKRLVEMMEGTIAIESEYGLGTSIVFTVRCDPSPEADARGHYEEFMIPQNVRVLVVDDNQTNRLILEEMLKSWKVDCTVLSEGKDVIGALELARQEQNPYQLVLTDVQMPDMDGFEVTERIRAHATLKNTIVVMLSSADAVNYQERCVQLDLGAYLTKPIKQSELLETLVDVLRRRTRPRALPVPEKTSEKNRPDTSAKLNRALRILVAEDNFVYQQLMLRVLQKDGHDVIVANHGAEAVEILQNESVDVVLMDVQMPHLDGYEATAQIRSAQRTARGGGHLPIIALTANAMKGDREKCLEAGMDDYVTKPINFSRLFETIGTYMPDEKPEEEVIPTSDRAQLSSSEEELVVIDSEALLNRVDSDLELITILTDAFREDGSRTLNNLRTALETRDQKAAARAAHTLKGTAGNLSGLRLAAAASAMERSAAEGNFENASALFVRLETCFHDLQQSLNEFTVTQTCGKN
jgi:two-component system sensor histidine kinase/response regulator